EEPKDLRDRVWTPGELTWANGGQVPVLVPTRYPGVEDFPRDSLKLSRETEWTDAGGETFVGLGQRVFATESRDIAIMDLRSLVLDVEMTGGAADMAALAEEVAAENDAGSEEGREESGHG
ncbi:MAG TPA: type VI secretion system accessory protein TagJ, partial [Myxococcota bacterium]|nr:type VI secretion system accessory protein TagJ [Myxococcota bacterium]